MHHEFIEKPTVVADAVGAGSGSIVVQYPFIKTWKNGDGEVQRWSSIDSEKPRNKVERLEFDEKGQLARVSVVELDSSES